MKESNDTYGLGKKRKKTIYEYKIEIENLKNNALDLTLKDRIPVSSDTDIKVEITDMDPKNDNNIAGDQGIILWKLFLKSREKKVIHFTYYLDRPEDLNFYFQ